jgi:hypothetical protein
MQWNRRSELLGFGGPKLELVVRGVELLGFGGPKLELVVRGV